MDEKTKSAILRELDLYASDYPLIQEGDITAEDVSQDRGMTNKNAVEFMRRVAKSDPERWEMIKAVKKAGATRFLWVLRKKLLS